MKTFKLKKNFIASSVLGFAILFIFCVNNNFAQSTNQDSPTPITSNEINGEIRPRAVGDPRLTNYFFTFSGNQGDIFINVVTSNLEGDIDIFTFQRLEPLTKIPVFAGVQENETGRVIYLRKSEKLILRIQGRTPNNEPAKFQIKFAGSFVPVESVANNGNPQLPEIDIKDQGEARVSSVGTIIEVFPKKLDEPKSNISSKIENKELEETEVPGKEITISTINKEEENFQNTTRIEIKKENSEDSTETLAEKNVPKVIVTDNLEGLKTEDPVKSEVEKEEADEANNSINSDEKKSEIVAKSDSNEPENVEEKTNPEISKEEIQPVEPNQLANISLLVKFKDGTKFKRTMDKITWFNVDKGILTIITNDGTILKFSMLNVEKMTFETGN
jgi:hypothetical protein